MMKPVGQIERMQQEAINQMLHYQDKSQSKICREWIKKAAGRYVPPTDPIFWTTGLLANTLAENVDCAPNREAVLTALTLYFDRWITAGMKIHYVDDILAGSALIQLYRLTGENRYKVGADKMAAYLYGLREHEADGAGTIPYRPAQKNYHIYADSIGMICPFLADYGSEFKEGRAWDLAVEQIKNMLSYGMDMNQMLPYHGFAFDSKLKYGIIGWGRAVGWLLMGITSLLAVLPKEHKDYAILTKSCTRILDKVCDCQQENGSFCWQLEAAEGPQDSSATAMIAVAAMRYAEVLQINEHKTAEACRRLQQRAEVFLSGCERDGKIYSCSGECLGYSQYPQIYGAYPWSLGPSLTVLSQKEWRAL